ncbi:MAG TPA: STAS domain-containing protein, partial [Longimicrobiales bacterium]|nr:STAS domain-containing protein [Longimicrobiales bacterium]
LLFLGKTSVAIRVVRVIQREDEWLEEREPPQSLESREVTVLDVYGDLFYAGARTLAERLPSARGARHPAVVLRLRGRTSAGATLVDVLASFAQQIERADGRLFLTGLRGNPTVDSREPRSCAGLGSCGSTKPPPSSASPPTTRWTQLASG